MRGHIEPMGYHAAATQVKASIVDAECYVPAPFPGHYEEVIPCGTRVEKGTTVAWLHDFHRIDDLPYPVRAGVSGIVVAQSWGAAVRQGQHILAVGQIIS
jgi:predicted deacylase